MQSQSTAQYALKTYEIFSYSGKSPNSFNNFFWYSGSDADLIKKATYVPKNPWSQYAAYSIIHDHVTYDPYHNYT